MNFTDRTADTPDTARAPRGRTATQVGGTDMTFAAVTLLGMTVGQPAAADQVWPMNSRTIKLPVEYKKDRKGIRQVLLYVARNGENTWYQEAFITPDKDAFVYVAKDDGVYWFKMVIEDLKGNKDPADLTRDPPDMKMVIDTVAPSIRVAATSRRTGDDIVVEWSVEDKFPNDAETRVHFRASDNPQGYWQEVTLPANSRTGVKFPCGTPNGVTVKISAADVAGNRSEITRDFPAGQTTTALSPPGDGGIKSTGGVGAPAPPVTPGGMSGGTIPPSPPDLKPPTGALPFDPSPTPPPAPGPITPPVVAPPPITPQPQPPVTPAPAPTPPVTSFPTPVYNNPPATNTGGPQRLDTIDPKAALPAPPAPASGATAAGMWTNAAAPAADLPRAQVINYPRFNLGFDLEQRGPSGISRVDLWVTRNEGQTWQKWSQHDGKNGAVTVSLDVRENATLEGLYGFRLVPVSGAGLSEREPVANDTPDMRVVLDITPPTIDLFAPTSDPNQPDTLVIQWKATDKNFGDDPITLEWSDAPTGPWKPVASAGTDPVIQATAINTPVARRLANTGQYSWRIPAGVPARVYLKASARDAAGNVKEVVTREPILVDLTKPRAKISGITPPVPPRP